MARNLHDSTVFPLLYNKHKTRYKGNKNVGVDAGCKIPSIAKMIIDDGKTLIMPYKRPMTKKGFFKKQDYVYDEYFDCYICPNNEVLKYSTTNPEKCKDCPYLRQCTKSKNHIKLFDLHVGESILSKHMIFTIPKVAKKSTHSEVK